MTDEFEPILFGPDLILLEELASGGMAQVFRARMTGTGGFEKTVAVKRILPHFASRPEFKAMFQREMNLCANMQHPNIVQVFKNGLYQGYLYLVMELVDGKNIAELIRETIAKGVVLPTSLACFIVAEAARGLAYAHGLRSEDSGELLGIVHRDISPQNIMVSYGGEVKVVDFGIAKAAQGVQLTKTGDVKGKASYLSPEYIREQKIDARSDIFALGVVFFELLTQRMLFSAENTFQAMHKVCELSISAPSTENSAVTPELDAIVMKALERDPALRWQNAQEFADKITIYMNQAFPEFTKSDFAKFLGSLFADERTKARERRRNQGSSIKSVAGQIGEPRTEGAGEETISIPAQAYEFDRMSKSKFYTYRKPILWTGLAAVMVLNIVMVIGIYRQWSYPTPISPRLFSRALVRFDAASLKRFDGDKIQEWVPVVGNAQPGRQYTPTSQAVFKYPSTNKAPLLLFDGIGNYYTADSVAALLRKQVSLTFITVGRVAEYSEKQCFWSIHRDDRNTDVLKFGVTYGGKVRLKTTPDIGHNYIESAPVDAKKLGVYTLVLDLGSIKLYLNGKEIIKSDLPYPVSLSRAATFTIGAEFDRGTPGDFLNGEIVELSIFGNAMSDPERQYYEKMLMSRYNIS